MLRLKVPTTHLLVLALLTVAGCANLGAVRDFAATSAKMTGYKDVTERYITSADRQLEDLPPQERHDGTRKVLLELKDTTAKQKDTLFKLHAATTGYMAALAGLAGKDAYSISGEIGKVSGAIVASEALGINTTHVQAYSNIVQKVADWAMAARQAKDVKRIVQQNGEDMDKLLEAMEFATEGYGRVLKQEATASAGLAEDRAFVWNEKMPGDTNSFTAERREVLAALLRKTSAAEKAAQADALKAHKAAASGLREVRQAHRKMVDNIDRLNAKDVQALLRKAASDLKSIREEIADL